MSKVRERKGNQLKAMLDMHNEVFDHENATLDKNLSWYGVVVLHSMMVLVVTFFMQCLWQ